MIIIKHLKTPAKSRSKFICHFYTEILRRSQKQDRKTPQKAASPERASLVDVEHLLPRFPTGLHEIVQAFFRQQAGGIWFPCKDLSISDSWEEWLIHELCHRYLALCGLPVHLHEVRTLPSMIWMRRKDPRAPAGASRISAGRLRSSMCGSEWIAFLMKGCLESNNDYLSSYG